TDGRRGRRSRSWARRPRKGGASAARGAEQRRDPCLPTASLTPRSAGALAGHAGVSPSGLRLSRRAVVGITVCVDSRGVATVISPASIGGGPGAPGPPAKAPPPAPPEGGGLARAHLPRLPRPRQR